MLTSDKNSQTTESLAELTFEERDLAVFNIPDLKTRLDTIQNYFFPRLEILLKQSLELVQEIYNVNPYERITFLYTPSHRKDAKNNKQDRPFVSIGIGGKRRNDRPLTVKRKDGQPYRLHNGRLDYMILPNGEINVRLWILGWLNVSLNAVFLGRWRTLLTGYFEILNSIFSLNHISHGDARNLLNFNETLSEEFIECLVEDSLQFSSSSYYFPVSFERGLFNLQMAFVALYPLLDASIDIEEGQPDRLAKMLNAYIEWVQDGGFGAWFQRHIKPEESETEDNQEIDLPELDNYRFIRAGLWWEILSRDNWTCCSCGRSVREHGIVLHVDHKVPRSKGGTDDRNNLQALCMKCNIGKSNRDSTDLTRKI